MPTIAALPLRLMLLSYPNFPRLIMQRLDCVKRSITRRVVLTGLRWLCNKALKLFRLILLRPATLTVVLGPDRFLTGRAFLFGGDDEKKSFHFLIRNSRSGLRPSRPGAAAEGLPCRCPGAGRSMVRDN